MAFKIKLKLYSKTGRIVKDPSRAAFYSASYKGFSLIKKGHLYGSKQEKIIHILKQSNRARRKLINFIGDKDKFYRIDLKGYDKNNKELKSFRSGFGTDYELKRLDKITFKWLGKTIFNKIAVNRKLPQGYKESMIEMVKEKIMNQIIKDTRIYRNNFLYNADYDDSILREKLINKPISNLRTIKKRGARELSRKLPFIFSDKVYKFDTKDDWYEKYKFTSITRSLVLENTYARVNQIYIKFNDIDLIASNELAYLNDVHISEQVDTLIKRLQRLTGNHIIDFWNNIKNREVKSIFVRLSYLMEYPSGNIEHKGFAIEMPLPKGSSNKSRSYFHNKKFYEKYLKRMFNSASKILSSYLKDKDGSGIINMNKIKITGLNLREYEDIKSENDKKIALKMEEKRILNKRNRKNKVQREYRRKKHGKKHQSKSVKSRKYKK